MVRIPLFHRDPISMSISEVRLFTRSFIDPGRMVQHFVNQSKSVTKNSASQLMVNIVGLGPGGLGFESGCTPVTIPVIRGFQESKPPSQTNPNTSSRDFWMHVIPNHPSEAGHE